MILATKLFPPPRRVGLLARPALCARLRAGLARPLTMIAAPAGFGKTTLLVEALAELSTLAWLTLDPEDSPPARFWAYVAAALGQVRPDLGAAAAAMLHEGPAPDFAALITSLLNDLAALPADLRLTLVLDDYQQIDNQAIHAQLDMLLDRLPPQLRVVILTRVDPPLSLARRRARGELYELRAADLRFSRAEIAAFFAINLAVQLDRSTLDALEMRTEGWIASLQLAALSVGPNDDPATRLAAFSGDERHVVDYLVDEVLARQPAAIQSFLLTTAILERLCAPLCAALFQAEPAACAANAPQSLTAGSADPAEPELLATNSQLLLEQIERANLFLIPLDGQRRWYRYHQLFAELLRQRLAREQTPAAIATLHRRAANWHAAHGEVGAALRHALAADDVGLAAATLEARYNEAVRRMDPVALVGWLAMLPAALLEQRPRLLLADAWRAMLQLDLPTLTTRIAQLEARLADPAAPPELRAELGAIAGRIALLRQDLAAATTSAQTALADLPSTPSFLRGMVLLNLGLAQRLADDLPSAEATLAEAARIGESIGEPLVAITALLAAANTRQIQAELHDAEALLRRAVAIPPAHLSGPPPTHELAQINLGWLRCERGDAAEGLALLEAGLALARRRHSERGILDGSTYLMLAARQAGDLALSARAEAEAAELATRYGPGLIALIVAERRARLRLLEGDWPSAARWAAGTDPSVPVSDFSEGPLHTYARTQLVVGRARGDQAALEAAASVLERLRAHAEARGLRERLLHALVGIALLQAIRGHEAAALDTIDAALDLAAPAGYVRLFRDEGAPLAALLNASAARRSPADPMRGLISHILGADPPPAQPLVEPLSEREREVLRLVAAGYSNAAIAARLVVAITTVKAHMRNIFAKLEVASRTHAVARARELGLIE